MTVAVKSHPVPVPLKELFCVGVPGTQRQRWVSLAVDNFGLGIRWF